MAKQQQDMEPSSLRSLIALLFTFLAIQSFASQPFNREEVKDRLLNMECIVKPRYTTVVENYIRGYFSGSTGSKASRIMGKAVMYFPIFEQYLKEHNLPTDLKYVAILESALNPKALSRVGAGGLWQFMKETGKGYGLTINADVDERSCPNMSTEAAMKYLTRQYEKYGSWELSLAAYNCGSGTIDYAVRRAKTKNYWSLSRYLPRETQNFVPAFLAAAYVGNFYHLHEVQPAYPNLDLQLTEGVKVFTKLDFITIAAVTGLPVETVAELNPAFKKSFVPENPNGHFVILPRRVMQAFNDYLTFFQPDAPRAADSASLPELQPVTELASYKPDECYYQSFYTISEGDSLESLAEIFSCSPYNLKAWNNLNSNELERGKELLVWFPKEFLRFKTGSQKVEIAAPAALTSTAPETSKTKSQPAEEAKAVAVALTEKKASSAPRQEKESSYVFHQLRRNESLLEVAEQFPGVTVKMLLEWNGYSKENLPVPGANLKIKKEVLRDKSLGGK